MDDKVKALFDVQPLAEIADYQPTEYCEIDVDERTISIPDEYRLAGVEADNDVKRIFFRCNKISQITDLSTFTVYINYLNANGDADRHICDDVEVRDNELYFSWLVSNFATAYKGNIRFIVCMIDDANNLHWNTTVASIEVLEGLEVDASIVEQNPDIIENMLLELQDHETRITNLEAGGGTGGTVSVRVGTTTTGEPGTDAVVTNSGTNQNAVFDFVIPRGAKGDKGDKGDKGETGDTGPQGPQGAAGKAATIQVGDVSTGDVASVTNVGTDTDAIFDFVFPVSGGGTPPDYAQLKQQVQTNEDVLEKLQLNGDRLQPIDLKTLQAIMDVGLTYITRTDMTYGHNTAYRHYSETEPSEETVSEIDCSSFTMLCYAGVPYEDSRYNPDRAENVWGSAGYCYKIYNNDEDYLNDKYAHTTSIARESVARGLCYLPADDYSNLQPGDMLFWGDTTTYPDRFMGIHHCAIFIGWASQTGRSSDGVKIAITMDTYDNNDEESVYSRPVVFAARTNLDKKETDKVVLCARYPVRTLFEQNINKENRVEVKSYTQEDIPVNFKEYTYYTVEFDAVLNTIDTYFMLTENGHERFSVRKSTQKDLGVQKHYKYNVACNMYGDVNTVKIKVIDDSGTPDYEIKNLVVSNKLVVGKTKPEYNFYTADNPYYVSGLMSKTSSEIYEMFEEYVSDGVITKELIGYASQATSSAPTGEATDDTTKPIYLYKLNKKISRSQIGTLADNTNGTVLITCAMHGNEKTPVAAMLNLCEEARRGSNPFVNEILNNMSIQFVAICNPGGFDTAATATLQQIKENSTGRVNPRGVNINRNARVGWQTQGGGSTQWGNNSYKGPSALSESETKALKVVEIDRASSWMFNLDLHCTQGDVVFQVFGENEMRALGTDVMAEMYSYMIEKYGVDLGEHYSEDYPATQALTVSGNPQGDWVTTKQYIHKRLTVEFKKFSEDPNDILPKDMQAYCAEYVMNVLYKLVGYLKINGQRDHDQRRMFFNIEQANGNLIDFSSMPFVNGAFNEADGSIRQEYIDGTRLITKDWIELEEGKSYELSIASTYSAPTWVNYGYQKEDGTCDTGSFIQSGQRVQINSEAKRVKIWMAFGELKKGEARADYLGWFYYPVLKEVH